MPDEKQAMKKVFIGPYTPQNCILYIAEKDGIFLLRICILYNNPQSEYFGMLLSLKSVLGPLFDEWAMFFVKNI